MAAQVIDGKIIAAKIKEQLQTEITLAQGRRYCAASGDDTDRFKRRRKGLCGESGQNFAKYWYRAFVDRDER